jgi:hypothetical protein
LIKDKTMALNKIKPVVEEIDGKRCVVVETGASAERADFLTKLLKHNKYEVCTTTAADGTITVGVTDMLFNPVLDVYKRRLRSFTNHHVTPAYWLQTSNAETIEEVNYWM